MIIGDRQNINHASKLKELKNIGLEVFETTERFNSWLNMPYLLFEDARLLSILDSQENIQKVIDEFGRTKNGVY